MDYDATSLPDGYDRGRDHGPAVANLWMDAIAAHVGARPIHTILDVGCGTGRFSNSLATRFSACLVGIDPSRKMIVQARSKSASGPMTYLRAGAEAVPLVDDSIDLVFISMAFHHFENHREAACESRRVLRSEGFVVVRT